MDDERRAESRTEIALEVHYRTPHEFVTAYAKNISGGGIFIRTDTPEPLNQLILLRFTLPGLERTFEVRGLVVWSHLPSPRTSFPAGMGVKFLDVSAEDKQAITEILSVAGQQPGQKQGQKAAATAARPQERSD